MPTVSVITPVAAGGAAYLAEASRSLDSQELPPGWALEWLLHEDGHPGTPVTVVPNDPPIRFGAGRRGGAARARNLGLARATGDVVRSLDADDILPPGALARDVEAVTGGAAARWTCSATLDLLPGGRLVGVDTDPATGVIPRGALLTGYVQGRLQVVGTTVCAPTDLVSALVAGPRCRPARTSGSYSRSTPSPTDASSGPPGSGTARATTGSGKRPPNRRSSTPTSYAPARRC